MCFIHVDILLPDIARGIAGRGGNFGRKDTDFTGTQKAIPVENGFFIKVYFFGVLG